MTKKDMIQLVHDLNEAVRQKYAAVGMADLYDGQPLAQRAQAAMRFLGTGSTLNEEEQSVVDKIRDLAVSRGSMAQQSRYWERVDKFNRDNPARRGHTVNGLSYALGYEDALMNIDRCHMVPEAMGARLMYADGARQAREDMR